MPDSYNIQIKDIITVDNIQLGEWGVYSSPALEKQFKEDLMKTIGCDVTDPKTGGYSQVREAFTVKDLLNFTSGEITTLEEIVVNKMITQ